ncbi:MAG: DUF1579 family protein [archaeon]|nr:DUF1579 family protein [archaeon]MCP8321237.1 DUF1579 family protein [archaeon]
MKNDPTLSDMFPLPDEAKKLQIFVGDWKVKGTMTIEGETKKVKGVWKVVSVAAGWGVLGQLSMEIEGMGTFEQVAISGFDPGEKLVHLFMVSNMAVTRDRKGKWSDDNTLNLVYKGLQEGKNYKEQITVKFRSPKEFSIHDVETLDGQVISTLDVTLRK